MGYPVVDLHCDTLTRLLSPFNRKLHVTGKRLVRGGVRIQVFALFVPGKRIKQARRTALYEHDLLERISRDWGLYIARKPEEILQENLVAVPAIEGGEIIEKNEDFYTFERLGIRYITVVWNRQNRFGDPALSPAPVHNGLSEEGRWLVKEMERFKILPDVSHASEKTFWDIVDTAHGPVIASHSCCHALNPHPRNLKDEQIKAIGEKGGVVGINFSCEFLRGEKRCGIEDVIKHIAHVVEIAGIDTVALGSDFDGVRHLPRGLSTAAAYPLLEEGLRKYGFGEEEIRKIMGENALRVLSCGTHTRFTEREEK